MKVRYLFLACFLFAFLSCKEIESVISVEIISPLESWYYDDSNEIFFQTNIKNEAVKWFSSVDGYLGEGSVCHRKLTAGNHEIFLKSENLEELAKINITVNEFQKKQDYKYSLIQNKNYEFKDLNNFCVFSLDGRIKNINLNTSEFQINDDLMKCSDFRIDCTENGSFLVLKKNNRCIRQSEKSKNLYIAKTDVSGEFHEFDFNIFF